LGVRGFLVEDLRMRDLRWRVFLEFWISVSRLRAGYRLLISKQVGILTDFQTKVKKKLATENTEKINQACICPA